MNHLQSVNVQADRGSLFVDLREPSSHGLFSGQLPESAERSWVSRIIRPGQTVLDVGAHWGLYTVLLADLVGMSGKVFAFEPCPRVLPQLRKTVARLANVTLFELGLADRSGSASLVAPRDASMARLDPLRRGVPRDEHAIITTTVDQLVQEAVVVAADFIKCDVEGAEVLVFRGARSMLDRQNAPVLLFEHNPMAIALHGGFGEDAATWLTLLKAPRYRLFLIEESAALVPVEGLPPSLANVLAVPERRRSFLDDRMPHAAQG